MRAKRLLSRYGGLSRLLGAAGLLWVCSFTPVPAWAVISFTVTPARIEYNLESGEAKTQTVNIINRGDRALECATYLTDLLYTPQGQLAPGLAEQVSSPAASWVSIRPERVIIPPDKVGAFEVTVSLPQGIRSGGYLAMFVRSIPAFMGAGQSVPTAGEIGVHVLIRPSGVTPVLSARVAQVRPPTASEKFTAEVEIANTGSVHAWAELSMDLLGPFGDFVGYLVPSKPGKILFLPGQQKTILLEWGGSLSPAKYEAMATVDFDGDQVVVAESSFTVSEHEPLEAKAAVSTTRPTPERRAETKSAPVLKVPDQERQQIKQQLRQVREPPAGAHTSRLRRRKAQGSGA